MGGSLILFFTCLKFTYVISRRWRLTLVVVLVAVLVGVLVDPTEGCNHGVVQVPA